MARRREKTGATPAGRARREAVSDEGVKRCIELMTTGAWVSGLSNQLVAEQFGVSTETVKEWATSASRVIRLAIDDEDGRQNIKARMVTTLESIIANNAGRPGHRGGQTAVSAIAEQAKILGLVTTTHKVDVTVQAFERLEPAAQRAKLLEQRARIDEAIAALDAELPPPVAVDVAPGVIRTLSTDREAGQRLVGFADGGSDVST